jgi:hypothetical protein
LRRYRDGGASAVANQRRGRLSNNRLPDVVRDHAIALVRERYADFGPTFAAEKLAERHDLKVSRETLRSWMRQAGIWISRAERKRIQQPRHRREHIGELVRSTAQSIAGSRIEQLPARYWCSSTMRQAYRTSLALAERLCRTVDRIDPA